MPFVCKSFAVFTQKLIYEIMWKFIFSSYYLFGGGVYKSRGVSNWAHSITSTWLTAHLIKMHFIYHPCRTHTHSSTRTSPINDKWIDAAIWGEDMLVYVRQFPPGLYPSCLHLSVYHPYSFTLIFYISIIGLSTSRQFDECIFDVCSTRIKALRSHSLWFYIRVCPIVTCCRRFH